MIFFLFKKFSYFQRSLKGIINMCSDRLRNMELIEFKVIARHRSGWTEQKSSRGLLLFFGYRIKKAGFIFFGENSHFFFS